MRHTIAHVEFLRKKKYFNDVTVFHFCVQNFVESTGITLVTAKIFNAMIRFAQSLCNAVTQPESNPIS